MKFLIVLFAVVALATCKPSHQGGGGGQAQTFQVQVQQAPQQQQAPPAPPVSIVKRF